MTRYRFQQTYRSSYGAGAKDDVVDFADDHAAAINRDAPGTLIALDDAPEPDTRALDAAPHDRQMKRAPQKRTAADGQ